MSQATRAERRAARARPVPTIETIIYFVPTTNVEDQPSDKWLEQARATADVIRSDSSGPYWVLRLLADTTKMADARPPWNDGSDAAQLAGWLRAPVTALAVDRSQHQHLADVMHFSPTLVSLVRSLVLSESPRTIVVVLDWVWFQPWLVNQPFRPGRVYPATFRSSSEALLTYRQHAALLLPPQA
ncbi:hypothetical protein HJC99_02075 [Candidatus Saccharibacteria bacterium]|nr:hypothetical protein [Candidatus Saccharibacteria bacterium]